MPTVREVLTSVSATVITVDMSASLFAVTATLGDSGIAGTIVSGGISELAFSVENIVGTTIGDTMIGNADDNIFEGGAGNDSLDGGGGTDSASCANAVSAVTVDLSIQNNAQFVGGGRKALMPR